MVAVQVARPAEKATPTQMNWLIDWSYVVMTLPVSGP